MPEDGVQLKPREEILRFEEIERLATLFVQAGVDKIRLTGGEPLVRKGVDEIVSRIGRIVGLHAYGITTNGLLLQRFLPALRRAGITHVNVSLDTLKAARFQAITRREGLANVLESIEAVSQEADMQAKVNCVVMKGLNEDELADFVELTRSSAIEVRFIEYMPFDGNAWHSDTFVSYREQLDTLRKVFSLERLAEDPHSTSKRYRVPGYKGTVGFITSMSENFCSGCNRLRITADGSLKVCLFGQSEVSLRDAMRRGDTDADILNLVRSALRSKKEAHAGMFEIARSRNRPMVLIGG
jgi:cyclic pyranopterin phosphate synthase